MAEMPPPGEDHRGPGALHGCDHLVVPDRAARLDDRRYAGRDRELRAVGEGEERVRRKGRPGEVVAVLGRLREGDLHRVDPALLAGADADRLQRLRDDDRVGADVLADAPREQEVTPLLLVERAADDAHRLAIFDVPVAVLHEQPAQDPLQVALAAVVHAAVVIGEDPQRLALAQRRQRLGVVARRVDDVGELLRDARAQAALHLAVQRADHPERRQRVGRERALVRLLDRRRDGDAARVRVLDDHAGRQRELAQQQQRAVQVVEVDEGERLAAELLDLGKQVAPRAGLRVVGTALVRVLPVAEVLHLLEGERQRLREVVVLAEPGRDRRLVRRRRRERLGRETAPRLERELAALAQLAEDVAVLRRARDDGDVREVLRRCAQHRRPAYVDHLDHVLLTHAALRDGGREGIEVHADEVDRLDVLLRERVEVVGAIASREDAAVDARVQRLDAAAEHLGRLRHVLDARHRQSLLLEEGGRATARDELEAGLREPARERLELRLVVHGDQRAHSSLTTSGNSRCSTSWMRSTSESRGSTGTGSCLITGPLSTPSSTRWTVTPVVSTPAASASSIACSPGNSGSSDGWTLSAKTAVGIPASRALCNAGTSLWFDATATIGSSASISACKFVPSPLTSTPIRSARSSRSRARRRDRARRRRSRCRG